MKALVLGGTGFIGRRLVENLLRDDSDVTLATSGRSPNPFGDAVSTVTVDRFDLTSIEEKLSSPPYFDVLFDQICFGPDDAVKIVEAFENRIGHYVFVSSGSVYDNSKNSELGEKDFDPYSHKIQKGGIESLGYSEGKRSAEAYFFQNANFPVAAARFPIVVGHDDSTLRFQKLVEDVLEGREIYIPPNGKKRNYVWVDDAGRFLYWLGKNGKAGPYNASSPDRVDVVELLGLISEVTGVKPKVSSESGSGRPTSYYAKEEKILLEDKAAKEGFVFSPFGEWMRSEIGQVAKGKDVSPNSVEYFVRRLSGN